MAAVGEPAEDLVEVLFGAAGVRILAIQPVDDENPHGGLPGMCDRGQAPFARPL